MKMLFYMTKKDFIDAMKFRISRWGDFPGLSMWAQCSPKVLRRESRQGRVREQFGDAAGFGDGGRGEEPRSAGGMQRNSIQKEHSTANTQILAQ